MIFNVVFVLGVQQSDSVCLYANIHPFSDPFSISVITEYGVELPVLHSRALLVVCFKHSSVYTLIPNSSFIPPPPPFPFGNHNFVFEVCESVSVL